MMDGDPRPPGHCFSGASLGQLMPLYLWLDAACRVRGAGPTLLKLLGNAAIGRPLTEVFKLRMPRAVQGAPDLLRSPRLLMNLRAPPGTGFKGVAVPLQGETGVLLNLSFGAAVRDAVRDHGLSATDFAPTDLAIELLLLLEAKAAVMGEVTKMAERLRGAKARAEAEAFSDALTGLGNRRAMEAGLHELLAARASFAYLQLDLDYFKQVNDSLGHAAGDHVLSEVSARLRASLRGGDQVARVGGDEFVILLVGAHDEAQLQRLCQRIYERMRAPLTFEGQPCRVALSIGAVIVPAGCEISAARLIARADEALYASKGQGRGRATLMRSDGTLSLLARGPAGGGDRRRGAAAGRQGGGLNP